MRSLLIALLAVRAQSIITDCNTTSIFRPTEISLNPDPPVVGAPIYMTVKFENVGPEITAGTAVTSVTLNGLPFSPSTEPLCQNTACPIQAGLNDRSTSSTWPDVRGKVVTQSVWTNEDGENLLCLQTTVKVGDSNLRPANNNIGLDTLFRDDLTQKQIDLFRRLVLVKKCRVTPRWS